jgi:uncharacterized membrane protein
LQWHPPAIRAIMTAAAGANMASLASVNGKAWHERLLPDRVLAWAALVLLGFVVAALIRGRAELASVPPVVWPHLVTIMVALALTPVMLLRSKGDTRHRVIGYVWVAAMFGTALLSFRIRGSNHGNFSFIHILSLWVVIQVPLLVWRARRHDIVGHRRAVRAMVTGALLIAGFFTFPFDRLLGHWLFG